MSWVVLDNLQVLPDTVTAIHCDTRDFCCMIKTGIYSEDKKLLDDLDKYSTEDKFLVNQDEIFSVLSNIANISGGLDCTWRFLEFPLVENAGTNKIWECKYFRLYRINNTKFIFCNAHNKPIEWKLLTKENLIEPDLLCAH